MLVLTLPKAATQWHVQQSKTPVAFPLLCKVLVGVIGKKREVGISGDVAKSSRGMQHQWCKMPPDFRVEFQG
ncbi:MAG: hypothetical protein EPN14_10640 [Gallionella sp.]|nr:MAG: hypothetical protein EPN14_10640 [Gallionella sp.]